MRIPTIKELQASINSDLKNHLNLSDDNLKKVVDAMSIVLAAQLKLLYLNLSDVQDNIFPDKADTSENGGTLDRLGNIWLNRNRNPATQGTLKLKINTEIGTTLRAGLTFKSNEDSLNPGQIYILDNEFTSSLEVDFIEVRSLESGKDTILEIDDTLTVTEPVLGLEKVASVSTIVSLALSEESVDDYRRSIEKSIQLEPQGGARTDYREWASDAQGVREVYPYLKESSAGTVQVYVEATKEDSLNGNGVPSSDLLTSVEEVILFDPDTTVETNARGRKPMQCTLEVLPISLIPVDITITSLNTNSSDITNVLRSNLENYLFDVRPYVAGADLARNQNDILYLAKAQAVITDTLSTGNFFSGITMLVDGVSQNSYLLSRDKIPYLRNLNFN